jgi:uncharacterized protein YkwD
MKKIILLSLILFYSLFSNAQSDLDYLLFTKICKYREDNGLNCWDWDGDAWKVARSHSLFQSNIGLVQHSGNSEKRKYAGERFTSYNIFWTYVGENCAVIDTPELNEDEIACKILEMWKQSPPHNKLLLSEKAPMGAVSCIKGTHYKWSQDYEWTYATLNIYEQ